MGHTNVFLGIFKGMYFRVRRLLGPLYAHPVAKQHLLR